MVSTDDGTGVGPVPFKGIGDDDGVAAPPAGCADIVAALPSHPEPQMRCYQGMWVFDFVIQGIIDVQRRFTPRRRGDVVLVSQPKCGTTWLKALAFAVMARGTHSPAAAEHPLRRLNPHGCVPNIERVAADGWWSKMDALPSPRLLSTHIHYSLLPASITNHPDCRMVYVCREPKDMVVSFWHMWRSIHPEVPFSDLFEAACEGKSTAGPIWEHILGYWNASKSNPEKVLFLMYEDMLRDPANNVRKLAWFIGQPFSPAEEDAGVVANIVELCSFEKLKNLEVNKTGLTFPFSNKAYFRKGKVGDWKNHMTPEMAKRLDAIVQEKLRGSGLTFT